MSRPLGSAPTPASRNFTATTGRSAGEGRIGTPCLRSAASARSLSRPGGYTSPSERSTVSTLAFSRSVQEPQTRVTPSPRRAPPGPYTGTCQAHSRERDQDPRFRCHPIIDDASTTNSERDHRSELLARLPGPHLTRSSRAFSLSLTTTVFSQRSTGWFDACPRRPTSKGQPSFISRTAPLSAMVTYITSPPAFVTHGPEKPTRETRISDERRNEKPLVRRLHPCTRCAPDQRS